MASIHELVFFFKQKTAYEVRISDWSSDVCSSDLRPLDILAVARHQPAPGIEVGRSRDLADRGHAGCDRGVARHLGGRCLEPHARTLDPQCLEPRARHAAQPVETRLGFRSVRIEHPHPERSEEHTSELQSLMRTSYAVFCLKKKKTTNV